MIIQEIAQKIKLIAFDLDGTLLNQDHRVSKRNGDMILKLKEKGYKLLVSTGRTMPETARLCGGLPFDGYVCSNGMLTYDDNFKLMNEEWIQADTLLNVIDQLRSSKINYEMHDKHGDFYIIQEDSSFTNKRSDEVKLITENEFLHNIKQEKLKIVKFLILTIHNKIVITDHLKVDGLPVSLIAVSPYNVEVNKAGINKWIGLQFLLDHFDISGDRVLSFGDSSNDIEILKRSGWSVAMQNAGDHVKSNARDITLSYKEDGVAHYLEKYFI